MHISEMITTSILVLADNSWTIKHQTQNKQQQKFMRFLSFIEMNIKENVVCVHCLQIYDDVIVCRHWP